MPLTQVQSGMLGASTQTYGFKNRIINGDMRIDQRNNGAAVNSNSATNPYSLDRWRNVTSTGSNTVSFQQSTNAPAGFINSLLSTSLAATNFTGNVYHAIRQPIEGTNCADLAWGTVNASTVTLSFWARSSLTGTFGGSLGNQQGTRSYPFTFTLSSANVWEYKTITVPGDTAGSWNTNNEGCINLWISLGAGPDRKGAAGAWNSSFHTSANGAVDVNATSGATFSLTGVQLEKGSTATSFDYRPYGIELALCQRYFEFVASSPMIVGQANSSNNVRGQVQYQIKRAAPTVTASSLGVANDNVFSVTINSVAFSNSNVNTSRYDCTLANNNLTDNGICYCEYAYSVSAEL